MYEHGEGEPQGIEELNKPDTLRDPEEVKEGEETPEEAQFRMATMAASAIGDFCEQESGSINRFDDKAFRDFVEAYATDGSFQWTPSVPSFKRITTTPPNYWRDRELFAVVIQNRLDTSDPELTDKLNSMIKENIEDINWKKENQPMNQETVDEFKRMLHEHMNDN